MTIAVDAFQVGSFTTCPVAATLTGQVPTAVACSLERERAGAATDEAQPRARATKGSSAARPASILALGVAMMFAARANADTPSCPPVTSLPGIVKVAVDGTRVPVGRVAITYDVVERSVCAAFTVDPKNARDIRPRTICFDASIYGRLTQRGEAVATATMLDGSQRELRLDRESETRMSTAYLQYRDDCSGRRPDAEPSF